MCSAKAPKCLKRREALSSPLKGPSIPVADPVFEQEHICPFSGWSPSVTLATSLLCWDPSWPPRAMCQCLPCRRRVCSGHPHGDIQGTPSHCHRPLQVDQSGLGLPSRDYYLNKTENEKVSVLPRVLHGPPCPAVSIPRCPPPAHLKEHSSVCFLM